MADLIIVEGYITISSPDPSKAQCPNCGAAYPESTCLVWHDCTADEWKPVVWKAVNMADIRYWGLSLRGWERRRRGLRMPVGRPT